VKPKCSRDFGKKIITVICCRCDGTQTILVSRDFPCCVGPSCPQPTRPQLKLTDDGNYCSETPIQDVFSLSGDTFFCVYKFQPLTLTPNHLTCALRCRKLRREIDLHGQFIIGEHFMVRVRADRRSDSSPQSQSLIRFHRSSTWASSELKRGFKADRKWNYVNSRLMFF
jgi:hypothetical protein